MQYWSNAKESLIGALFALTIAIIIIIIIIMLIIIIIIIVKYFIKNLIKTKGERIAQLDRQRGTQVLV